jgi:uncharacterized protein YneF (UPF0154 family)
MREVGMYCVIILVFCFGVFFAKFLLKQKIKRFQIARNQINEKKKYKCMTACGRRPSFPVIGVSAGRLFSKKKKKKKKKHTQKLDRRSIKQKTVTLEHHDYTIFAYIPSHPRNWAVLGKIYD